MPLYFAYGSNMDVEQLSSRCGEPVKEPLFNAQLENYQLAFTRNSARHQGAVADIVPRNGESVWGVVSEISEDAMARLDAEEGVNLDPPGCRRISLTVKAQTYDGQPARTCGGVEIADGAAIAVQSYQVVEKQSEQIPSGQQYLRQMISAASRWGLPPTYIKGLTYIDDSSAKFAVSDIKIGAEDPNESKVTHIYTKISPLYAVYQTPDRVAVQYADFGQIAESQRKAMAPLNGVRSQINGLINGWRNSRASWFRKRARRYDARVAAALVLALEGDSENALLALNDTKEEVLAERTSWGRFEYLLSALGVVIIALIAFTWAQKIYPFTTPSDNLWLSARAGTIGAFFSIALGIQNRTILTNLRRRDNMADASLRIVIGVIAAGVLVLLLGSNIVPTVNTGELKISGNQITWQTILIIGFVAGFFERLVPDLLSSRTKAGGDGQPGGATGRPGTGATP